MASKITKPQQQWEKQTCSVFRFDSISEYFLRSSSISHCIWVILSLSAWIACCSVSLPFCFVASNSTSKSLTYITNHNYQTEPRIHRMVMIHANPLSVQLRMHKTTKQSNLENHTILNTTWKLKVHFVFIKHEPVITK